MSDPRAFDTLLREAKAAIAAAGDPGALTLVRAAYLGRKGRLTMALRALQELPEGERRRAGQAGNAAKREVEKLLAHAERRLRPAERPAFVDPTLPGSSPEAGHRHPISLILEEVEGIFLSLGFSVVDGPEVEDDWHNFEALNMGPEHPARDMQDTFYVAGSADANGIYRTLPRTHTSGVQIRAMRNQTPPIRIIAPGKVYRNEAEDATHSAVFHQVEGLMVDRDTSFSDLKGVMTVMVKSLLGEDTKLRFRPSFFPYTEPSAEIDVSSPRVRDGAWLELAGSGMVHPKVLQNVGYDPARLRGFAFGMGLERLAMLRYGIADLRHFFKPDIRLLEQF